MIRGMGCVLGKHGRVQVAVEAGDESVACLGLPQDLEEAGQHHDTQKNHGVIIIGARDDNAKAEAEADADGSFSSEMGSA